jgi:hypothetical protein
MDALIRYARTLASGASPRTNGARPGGRARWESDGDGGSARIGWLDRNPSMGMSPSDSWQHRHESALGKVQ